MSSVSTLEPISPPEFPLAVDDLSFTIKQREFREAPEMPIKVWPGTNFSSRRSHSHSGEVAATKDTATRRVFKSRI